MAGRARCCSPLSPTEAESVLHALATRVRAAAVRRPTATRAPAADAWTIATGRWSSSCRRSSSWPFSTRAPARPTSARTSKRRWASRRRNGSKIRSAGISRSIRTTRRAGRARRRDCCSPASRCARCIACIARDGRVVWFHCEAKIVRRDDGRPWFIHGVGVRHHRPEDRPRWRSHEERNFVTAILDTVGALVVVLDPHGPDRPLQPRLRGDDRIHASRRSVTGASGSCSSTPIAAQLARAVRARCWPGGTPAELREPLAGPRRRAIG